MEVDILDPQLYVGDPFPTYGWLRENAPVYWDELNQIWIISKYEDIVYVSRNPQLFCSGQGVMPDADTPISIITMDDPRHAQLRGLISRGFTPRMVRNLENRIREVVRQTIDAIADRGRCDFVKDLAVPLPLLVIAEMIGIRSGDLEKFTEWSDTMILAAGQEANEEIITKASRAFVEYADYLQEIFAERRKNPREDLVSILVAAQSDGTLASDKDITADELLQFMTILLVAGNETTRNAISGGMLALIEHPKQRAKLIANPALINSATEEILRWVTPVIGFRRTATEDTELRGKKIRKGQRVWMLYQSANRDPDAFPDPDVFNIERTPNYHLAFGVGPHFCLGGNLARAEIRAMIGELMRRLPDIELEPGSAPVRVPSPLVRGIASMPVVFTPERSARAASNQ